MRDDAVHIENVSVHQVLGIRRGSGFELTELSPGINLVFGPNGSGKSTTCKVVQELLWPGHLERPSVSGLIVSGKGEWRIDIDAGHPRFYRDGRADGRPDFGSSEARERYRLGLHDLIVDDHENFARRIVEASQGGYDLDAAAAALNFRANPKSRSKEYKELQARQALVKAARDVQLEVMSDARHLKELSRQLERAAQAERELAVLQAVRKIHEIEEECERLERQLAEFDERVSRLLGNEREMLDELKRKEERLREQLRAETERIRRAEVQKSEANLPDGEIPSAQLLELQAWRQDLRSLEARIAEQVRQRDDAQKRVTEALRRIGEHLSDEQLAAIDKLENTDLSIFSRKVHRVRARREVLEQRRAWLAKDPPEVVRELTRDDLRRGIELLSEWLSAEAAVRKTRQHPWIIIVGALLIAGLGVAFSVESTNWLWSLAVVAAAALLAVDRWLARNQRGTDDHRPIHQHAFERLPVPGPAAWRRSEVHVAIERLADLVGKRALVEERLTRLDQLASEEAALIRDEQELLAERSALQERLGLAFEIDDEWLPLLINRISEWQEASARLAGAERVLESLEKEADRIRTGLDEVLKPLGYVAIHSADHAEQLILDLQSRTSGFSSARRVLEDAHRAISESIEPELVEIQSSRAKIFERLQIAEDEEALIDEWLQRRASWIKCSDGLRSQQALLEDVRSDLQTTIDGLDSELDAWLEIDRLELERRIEKCLERADRRDELNKEDGRIRERIEAAKRGHELTDALAASDQALATLEAAREENRRAVVGSALTEWVREVAVDRSRPAVFQRANELFVRFTQGTFRLEMDDRSNPPRFLARRGDLPAQDLDELSDGERIQLMMAVRLAFLEQDERVPLPLLVDEVLGTSDDTRSEVMIDTMIEIAREGRQVFYCTAQGDEVAKWIARLESAEVPYKLVDLAQIRRLSRATRVPLVADIQRKSLPPKPDGLGYFEYGQLLGVSGIDPMSRTIDDVHIWHLFDDAKTVYKLLCQQITTWGQLRTLLEHGGAGVLGPSPDLPRQARAAANAIQAACEGYRVGRGKLVDRDALLDSGCVSERFIGELADLAQRLHGDAEALLAALAAKKVANWRCDRTEALREYFECEGYLSDVDPLTRTELRMRVLAAVSSEIGADVLDTGFVDRTIAALPFD